jgi:cystathionine beta-synthase
MPNQYFNPVNAEAHYRSLGPEIWNQTNGKVTHVFAAAGTGGHCTGIARYLKEQNPDVKVIALDSNNSWRATKGNPKPYKVEGMGLDFASPVFDESLIHEILEITDEDAFKVLKNLAHCHGILAGPSSGAVAAGVIQYASQLTENDLAVLIFGDSGRAYLTKNLFEKEYPYPDKMPRTGEMEVI